MTRTWAQRQRRRDVQLAYGRGEFQRPLPRPVAKECDLCWSLACPSFFYGECPNRGRPTITPGPSPPLSPSLTARPSTGSQSHESQSALPRPASILPRLLSLIQSCREDSKIPLSIDKPSPGAAGPTTLRRLENLIEEMRHLPASTNHTRAPTPLTPSTSSWGGPPAAPPSPPADIVPLLPHQRSKEWDNQHAMEGSSFCPYIHGSRNCPHHRGMGVIEFGNWRTKSYPEIV
jgi:hypothetical protein